MYSGVGVDAAFATVVYVNVCVAVRGRPREAEGWEYVVTAKLQRVRRAWWHALCSHIHTQADISMTMYLPAGIWCQLVALSWWWNIGLTELNCNITFLIRVPFHVRVSHRQNDNHGSKSHYAQSSITCAALIIAVSTQGLWAVISLPHVHTHALVCSFWSQPSVMKRQSSVWNEQQVHCLKRMMIFLALTTASVIVWALWLLLAVVQS